MTDRTWALVGLIVLSPIDAALGVLYVRVTIKGGSDESRHAAERP